MMTAETLPHFDARAQPFGWPVFGESASLERVIHIAKPAQIVVIAFLAAIAQLECRAELEIFGVEKREAGALAPGRRPCRRTRPRTRTCRSMWLRRGPISQEIRPSSTPIGSRSCSPRAHRPRPTVWSICAPGPARVAACRRRRPCPRARKGRAPLKGRLLPEPVVASFQTPRP